MHACSCADVYMRCVCKSVSALYYSWLACRVLKSNSLARQQPRQQVVAWQSDDARFYCNDSSPTAARRRCSITYEAEYHNLVF